MREAAGLKVEYIPPREVLNEQEEHQRLVRFVTLFAQIGFKELALNPETNIRLNV